MLGTFKRERDKMFDRPIELSSKEIKFYDDNGYLVVENVISSEEQDMTQLIFERHARLIGDTEFKAVMNLDRPEEWTDIYEPIGTTWIHHYIRQMLLKDPAIVTILETLQRTEPGNIVLMQSMFLFKKAKTGYDEQAWLPHQDGIYHGSPLGGTLTANIIFTDQDRENGGMFIHPGSHKEGFLEPEKKKSFHEGRGNRPGHDLSNHPLYKEKYEGKAVDLQMKAGSVLFLHSAVIHGSYPNISENRDRPMLLSPYKTKGLPFTPGSVGKRLEIPTR